MDFKKMQEEFEAEAEKALMETYNALYKLQDCISPVRCCDMSCNGHGQHQDLRSLLCADRSTFLLLLLPFLFFDGLVSHVC